MRAAHAITFLLLGACGFAPASVAARKFLPDDPIQEDADRLPAPKPAEIELSQGYDFLENTFGGDTKPSWAENVNTLGELPNSSWFTNRIGISARSSRGQEPAPMSLEELVRGPDRGTGPDTSGPWTITKSKTQGVTPGFTIKDPRGDTYFIKFDPLGNAQMSTSTEVICTKFFHALGYNVPENYLTTIRPEQLEISPTAQVTDEDGKKRPMRHEDLDRIFKRVPRRPDGTVQAVASLRLSGEPLGPYLYSSTRTDDPNDIFPHQMRRELRGLRVFAAWLNHDDSRSINSLDMYIREGESGWVKHYLIDFGSCLGSGSVRPQNPRAGNEYILEGKPTLKSAVTLGLWDRPWRKVKYPDYPAIGKFEGDFFQPQLWRPEYPNPAFDHMDDEDALWATRIVMRFTDDIIRAIVKTGQIDDPKAEEYLVQTLIKRRDKIVAYYLTRIPPLTDFAAAGHAGKLEMAFHDLARDAGLASASRYRYQWFRFDNEKETTEPLGTASVTETPSLPVPDDAAAFLMARIEIVDPPYPGWQHPVNVYLRNGEKRDVVGIERH